MKSFLLIFILLSPSAWADKAGPCAIDGPKFCTGVPFKGGKMFRCLVSQIPKDVLSEGCSNHLKALVHHKKVCESQIEKHCNQAPFYCLLWASRADVRASAECEKSILAKATYRERCQPEIKQFCGNFTGIEDKVQLVSCLKSNKKGLSATCSKELDK